jgi:hypothetical protein
LGEALFPAVPKRRERSQGVTPCGLLEALSKIHLPRKPQNKQAAVFQEISVDLGKVCAGKPVLAVLCFWLPCKLLTAGDGGYWEGEEGDLDSQWHGISNQPIDRSKDQVHGSEIPSAPEFVLGT